MSKHTPLSLRPESARCACSAPAAARRVCSHALFSLLSDWRWVAAVFGWLLMGYLNRNWLYTPLHWCVLRVSLVRSDCTQGCAGCCGTVLRPRKLPPTDPTGTALEETGRRRSRVDGGLVCSARPHTPRQLDHRYVASHPPHLLSRPWRIYRTLLSLQSSQHAELMPLVQKDDRDIPLTLFVASFFSDIYGKVNNNLINRIIGSHALLSFTIALLPLWLVLGEGGRYPVRSHRAVMCPRLHDP